MSKTAIYSAELYADIMANMEDYYQTGETVCGAEDPAVITLSPTFADKHPEYAGYGVVRVVDRYVSPWSSDTELVFSNDPLTADEYRQYEETVGD